MEITNDGASTQKLGRIVRRCTVKSLLFVSAVAALAVAFAGSITAQLPGLTLQECAIFALSITAFAAIYNSLQRSKLFNKTQKQPTMGPLLGVALRDALLADLIAISRRAGLRNVLKLCVDDKLAGRVASVYHYFGGTCVRVYVRQDIASRGYTRAEVSSIFAHEVGHVLLETCFWSDYVLDVVAVFYVAIVFLPVFVWATLAGHALLPHPIYLSLVGSTLFVLALFKALSSIWDVVTSAFSRMHEAACDQISTVLTGRGKLASALLKTQHRALHGPAPAASKWAKYWPRLHRWWQKITATHPHVLKRVESNRRRFP
jgi:hypothetical protein